MTAKILRVKDYMNIFNVSERTARRWMNVDRIQVKTKRLTSQHVERLYGITLQDIGWSAVGRA